MSAADAMPSGDGQSAELALVVGMPAPRMAEADGRSLALRRSNPPSPDDAPPVLLLHGVPETSLTWRHLMRALGDERVVLAPDLPGLGSSAFGGAYDLPSVARTLEAFLAEEVGTTAVDVVGHDWGGGAALALATAFPARVRRLVVISFPWPKVDVVRGFHIPLFGYGPPRAFQRAGRQITSLMFRYAWKGPRPVEPAALRAYRNAYAEPERVDAMLGYYRAAVRRAKTPAGGAGDGQRPGGPTPERSLVVWGVRDPSVPLRSGEAVVRDLGRSAGPASVRMLTVPSVGHWPHEEAPVVVTPAVAGFLLAP